MSRASQGAGDSTLGLSARGGPVPPLPILASTRTPAVAWGAGGMLVPLTMRQGLSHGAAIILSPRNLSPSPIPEPCREARANGVTGTHARTPRAAAELGTGTDTACQRFLPELPPLPLLTAPVPSSHPIDGDVDPDDLMQWGGVEGGHGPGALAAGRGTPHPGGIAVFLPQGTKPSPALSRAARSWAPARDSLGPAWPEGFKRRERGKQEVEWMKDAVGAKCATVAERLVATSVLGHPPRELQQSAATDPPMFWGHSPRSPSHSPPRLHCSGEGPVAGRAAGTPGTGTKQCDGGDSSSQGLPGAPAALSHPWADGRGATHRLALQVEVLMPALGYFRLLELPVRRGCCTRKSSKEPDLPAPGQHPNSSVPADLQGLVPRALWRDSPFPGHWVPKRLPRGPFPSPAASLSSAAGVALLIIIVNCPAGNPRK